MSAYDCVGMLNPFVHQQQRWVYKLCFPLCSHHHGEYTAGLLPSTSGMLPVAVGQNRYLVVLEKIKEREPWKSRKLRCQFGIVSLFLYCFTLRENEMWTNLQGKQVTRTYIIISQRFCKEVEKLQIIFRHQLDQCRLRGWLGCMQCEKLHKIYSSTTLHINVYYFSILCSHL